MKTSSAVYCSLLIVLTHLGISMREIGLVKIPNVRGFRYRVSAINLRETLAEDLKTGTQIRLDYQKVCR